ncbi:putative NAD dependent epimerase/dehydratase [Piedraia hortae CBS 480.64]|uniref:Putative NAD dependent epimerase/dehydratase n=1 Tax=Piedraia hortae CBS 480.64 TaxID=1314780 RepID=A0A6A7C490_9PEZI|nr:putative NAD dependent epimerase/dehydratase [Piedraia hortae CBS 480.64]
MSRVLLTGGSGFIAAHILECLLQRGHRVVTTVRTQQKAQKIAERYSNYGKDKLDFAFVEDIAAPNAFDKAVVSDPPFDTVIHTASPFHYNVTDIKKDLLDPAINGTKGMLQAIYSHAPTVRRVVILSSFAAVINPTKGNWPEHTYTEADWNPVTLEEAMQRDASTGYRASKTFAEKAAWDFVHEMSPRFSVTTICPPMVFGPPIHYMASPLKDLNTSNCLIRDMMQGKHKTEIPQNGTFIYVDVRYLALCIVIAMERPDLVGNKRLLVIQGYFSNKEIADILRSSFPQHKDVLPAADAKGGNYPPEGPYKYDSSRMKQLMGNQGSNLLVNGKAIKDTAQWLDTVGVWP